VLTGLEQLGVLAPFLLLVAAVLALPITSLLLRRYRRSVATLMSATGSDIPAARTAHPVTGGHAPADAPAAEVLARRRLVHVAITVGAGLFVGISYTWLFYFWNDVEVLPYRSVFLVLMFSWPAVPGVWVSTDGDRRWTLTAVAVYFAAAVTVSLAGRAGIGNALVGWVFFNGLPTVVVAAFFSRAFRAVGVLVLGVALLAVTGSQALLGTLESDAASRLAVELGSLVGIEDAVAIFVLVPLIGFVVAAAAGWMVLMGLGRWYARHGFSDHMLLLGSMCFVFCVDYVSAAAGGQLGALAIGLGLFGVLAVGALWVYHWFVHRSGQVSRLLLLRVFDHGAGTAGLLDAVAARWRHIGPVRLIGAPDLADSTIEPDEFLAFTSGRLRRLFIDSAAALDERLAGLEPAHDPDGRYRVEEFFCFDTTWRAAVESLLAESDLVLMDVRGFTSDRLGATHELELLGRERAFDRTLLVMDEHTDTDLVDRIVTGTGSATPRRYQAGADAMPDEIVHALIGVGPAGR
jgi:hypothetical protein